MVKWPVHVVSATDLKTLYNVKFREIYLAMKDQHWVNLFGKGLNVTTFIYI